MSLHANMRQLARLEYSANHNKRLSLKNIRDIFGYYSIDLDTIRFWFEKFKQEKLSKSIDDVKYKLELSKMFSNDTNRFLRGMISQVKCHILHGMSNTFDGRVCYAVAKDGLVVFDMFRGEYRLAPFFFGSNSCRPIEFIDEERFLVVSLCSNKLGLYKLQFEALIVEKLDEVPLDYRLWGGCLITDKQKLNSFVVHTFDKNRTLCTGNVVNDRIVIGETIRLEAGVSWAALDGQKVRFLRRRNSVSCKLCELDLLTLDVTSVQIPTKFSKREHFDLKNAMLHFLGYTWHDNRLYLAYKPQGNACKIIALDFETHEWHDTGIEVLNYVNKIHIDQDEILTAIAYNSSDTVSFYRFPLKKSDSLINLAWISHTRSFVKTGKRGEFFDDLPYTCELQSIWSDG